MPTENASDFAIDPDRARALLHSIARNCSQEASNTTILDDVKSSGVGMSEPTLRVYSSVFGGDVYHYRDKGNLEVDAILRLQDGRWAGIEVKPGGTKRIEEGAGNLKKLAGKVDHEAMGRPAFLMVLTGGEFAYTKNDGVHVVPLGCLMP